ncbi:type IV pilin protein [Shewanella surugensis]|uniref:Prepilin-type N-terminal cleavage/methylation domain-containing protein n=1 Tax=Shewanella surugensis TaxID=212020 RepID=A0ABT0L5T3_9GAMM|nr:type IV pilin protein [Shewanella surugensis]MCL1123048.1 prepilin-type N-terminal cleavage/methylation domain-containing protein [Shewanella surugensis]
MKIRCLTLGYSLVELMIVVIIIGILSIMGYPLYADYMTQSARTEAITALTHLTNLQEQFYFDNREYATDLTDLGVNADPYITDKGFYSISSTGTTDFTMVATAQGIQASRDSDCGEITITYEGSRTPVGCW